MGNKDSDEAGVTETLAPASGERSSMASGEQDSFDALLKRAAKIPDASEAGDDRGAANDLADLPPVGAVIAEKYRLDEQIGSGGMGAVYKATHLVSGKRSAIKVMHPSVARSESGRARFVRESRAAARIDHPNMVDVYDIGEHEGAAYLVMELLHGQSLRDRIKEGPMGPEETARTLLPCLRGVAAAHAEGVIHRDLKPDNIFLCTGPDGSPREPKVLDFGISKVLARDGETDHTVTREGSSIGTPAYMSPEQLRDAAKVDVRTDVYAFGVILYECMAGCLPFDATSYNALIMAIAQDAPMPLSVLRDEVPEELQAVVVRAMHRDPQERYQSVRELATDLEPYAGEPFSVDKSSPRATAPSIPESQRDIEEAATQQSLATGDVPTKSTPWALIGVGVVAAVGLAWALMPSSTASEPSAEQPAAVAAQREAAELAAKERAAVAAQREAAELAAKERAAAEKAAAEKAAAEKAAEEKAAADKAAEEDAAELKAEAEKAAAEAAAKAAAARAKRAKARPRPEPAAKKKKAEPAPSPKPKGRSGGIRLDDL